MADRIERNARRWRTQAAWAALPLLIACGGSDPETLLDKAGSWAATTRELAIERRVGGVGRAYTVDLLDAGGRKVAEIARSMDPSALPADLRERASATVAELDSLMRRTADQVHRGDLVALGTSAAAADSLGRTLDSLRTAAGVK
jgi:hypothetical protein